MGQEDGRPAGITRYALVWIDNLMAESVEEVILTSIDPLCSTARTGPISTRWVFCVGALAARCRDVQMAVTCGDRGYLLVHFGHATIPAVRS